MTVLIPFAGLSPVPWKNGGGSTIEIAIGPPDAGFDDFDWRVSLATISEDGAFSQFPGVDRTLALVDGHGLTLQIDGEPTLISDAEPVIAFDGASEVQARLNRGPTLDFNVMSRSERCWHQFGRRRLSGDSTFVARAEVTVLFLAEGDSLQLASDDERIGLVRYDAVILDQGTVWSLEAGQATIFIVDVHYYSEDDDAEMYD
ncbi:MULTISPECIES: HutD family protein [Massilia]|uniref:HutD/Ves family protein n=1 Tax=Massilia aurea TaxID=373040 RepID=A0A422QE71_9BURK|nr:MULTISPECIES: HutD family protein [Massilia]MDY0961562.1 HutD family protein [Massilia sp. CFBP9026]RNF28254.1 HutD/Ves family protein [Massilia aurea]